MSPFLFPHSFPFFFSPPVTEFELYDSGDERKGTWQEFCIEKGYHKPE